MQMVLLMIPTVGLPLRMTMKIFGLVLNKSTFYGVLPTIILPDFHSEVTQRLKDRITALSVRPTHTAETVLMNI